MLYGGSIPPGRFQGHDVTIQDVFEAVGAHAAGRMTDEELARARGASASPGAGACGGQFTANTMAMAFEVLGISPMGPIDGPRRRTPTKAEVAYEAGKLVVDVLQRGLRPSEIITREALENAIAARRLLAAARPTPCCTCSPSPARPASSSTIDDFDRISERTPLLCDLKPGGQYVAVDLYEAGGVPVVAPAPARGRPAARGRDHRHRARRSASSPTRPTETAGPARRAPARRPAQGHRRPGDPARQPRARGLRRQARRPRAPPPRGPGARLRRRGGGDGRRHARAASRPATSSSSATRARPAAPACARCSPSPAAINGAGPGRARRAAHRRALLRRHARLHGRPRRPRGGARRPDRRGPRRRRRSRSTSTRRRIDVALDDDEIAAPRRRLRGRRRTPTRTGVLAKYARARRQRLRGRGHAALSGGRGRAEPRASRRAAALAPRRRLGRARRTSLARRPRPGTPRAAR